MGIIQGPYWIRNSSTKTYLSMSADQSLAATQDKFAATETLHDHSQIWLAEQNSDGLSFNFRNAQTGGILAVKESAIEDGFVIPPNQQWKVKWISNSTDVRARRPRFRLLNLSTKKVLDQTSNPGWPARMSTWNGGESQLWSIELVSSRFLCRIGNVSSGRYLQYDTSNGIAATAKLPAADESLSQFWFLEYQFDGIDTDIIRNAQDEKKVLDLSESSIDQGNSIIVCDYHDGRNQKWRLDISVGGTETHMRVRIVSALGSVALQENSANKLEARNISNDDSQYWNMEQYPMPPIFWTTLQNLKSGSFLAQDKKNQSQLIPSTSSRNALDYTIHWCFVPQPNHPFHHFMIVNRATGWVLVGTTQSPSIYAAARDQVQSGHLWAIDDAGDGIGIFNTTTLGVLDHYAGDRIEAKPYRNSDWADNPLRRWISLQVSDRIPSFAIVNARTGRFINFVSANKTNGVKTEDKGINDFRNQWYYKKSSPGSKDGVFVIISKASGMVLDHFNGSRIEAYTDNMVNDPHHCWKVIPCSCGKDYYEIVNVATGRYLEERVTGTPNANATQLMDMSKDGRAQCWNIMSPEGCVFDNLFTDDY